MASVRIAVLLALTVNLARGGLVGTHLADEVPLTIRQKIDTLQQLMASRITGLSSSLGHQPAPADVAVQTRPGAPRGGRKANRRRT